MGSLDSIMKGSCPLMYGEMKETTSVDKVIDQWGGFSAGCLIYESVPNCLALMRTHNFLAHFEDTFKNSIGVTTITSVTLY